MMVFRAGLVLSVMLAPGLVLAHSQDTGPHGG